MIFEEPQNGVPSRLHHFTSPPATCEDSNFLILSPTLVTVCLLIIATPVGVRWYLICFKWHVKCNLYGFNCYWYWVFFMYSLYISMRLWVKIFLKLHGALRLWNLWYIFKNPSVYVPTYLPIYSSVHPSPIHHPSIIYFFSLRWPFKKYKHINEPYGQYRKRRNNIWILNLVNWLLEIYSTEIYIRFQCINTILKRKN